MSSYAYFQKKFIPLADAKIGIKTQALHYGTGVFEGIRGNWNADKQQMYIFRLPEHFERLHNGCKVLRINLDKTVSQFCDLTVEMVRKCGYKEDIYIRPLAYKSQEVLGVRLHDLEEDFLMFCFPWGPYLDMETARVGVSSWRRPADNSIPPQVKSTGIYLSSAQCKTEAVEHGYDEGIMLTPDGYVSEGSGENIFLVQHGKLVTPGVYSSILEGITRNSVIEVAAKELGIETEQRMVTRTELYTSDECFLTGTAANLTPVSEIDGCKVGENGGTGPITKKLQDLYFRIIKGDHPDYIDWCTPVY